MRLPVIERKAYTVSLQGYREEEQTLVFIHCDMHHPWTKTIKKQLAQDFDAFCELHNQTLWTLSELDDRKHYKFLTMFGFVYHMDMPLQNGRVMALYKKQGN